MMGMQRDDILRFKMVTDAQLNQRGEAAFAVVSVDAEQDRYLSHLYVATSDPALRQLTYVNCQSHSPVWSPDGQRLAFLSNRQGEKLQVWVMERGGGEAQQVTDFPGGVSQLAWSPDGGQVAVITRVKSTSNLPDIEELYPGDHRAKGAVRVFRRIQYKHATGMRDGQYAQVYVVSAQAQGAPLTQAQCLSSALAELDCGSLAWSPNGAEVAFVAAADAASQADGRLEIFVTPVATGQPRQLTCFGGSIGALAWSPQGGRLAFTGHDMQKRSASNSRVWQVNAAGENHIPQPLTGHLDVTTGASILADIRSPFQSPIPQGGLAWSEDESQIFCVVSQAGRAYVACLQLADGQLMPVAGGEKEVVLSFSRNASGQLVYLAENSLAPAELFFQNPGQPAFALTHFNAPWLSERRLAAPRELHIPADAEGHAPLGAWLLPPLDYDPSQQYPLLLEIHGGPHNAYGWSFFHEFHWLSAQGFFVLYTNPRGSQSYGEEVSASVVGDWGGGDYRDLMRAVDVVIQEPQVDAERLGVLGGSYGGYMTNWVVTQTNRFRAACTQRSVTNRMSMYGTSDIGYSFLESEGGTPWQGWQGLLERSAIWYADRVETPLLIIHSTQDIRCPIEQAHQLFVALKRLGKTAEFVMYEGENHGLSREGTPSRRLDRLERILQWFQTYLKP